MKGKEINGKWNETQHGFTKSRLCQTNLIFSFNNVTGFVDKGNSADLTWLITFDAVPCGELLVTVGNLTQNL